MTEADLIAKIDRQHAALDFVCGLRGKKHEQMTAWAMETADLLHDLKAALLVRKVERIDAARAEADRHYIDRLALCSDHRDKATGTCIVCQAEQRTNDEWRERRKNG